MFICKAQNIFLCSQNAPPFLYKYSPFKAFLRPFLFRLASHRAILRLLSSDRSSHFTPFPPFLFFIIPFLVHPKDWSFSSTIGCYSATSCQLAVESFFFPSEIPPPSDLLVLILRVEKSDLSEIGAFLRKIGVNFWLNLYFPSQVQPLNLVFWLDFVSEVVSDSQNLILPFLVPCCSQSVPACHLIKP